MQRLATVGTLTAMVAHEFNNILTPMHSYAQLASGGDEAMRDKAIRHTLEGTSRAAAICHAILDLAGRDDERPRAVRLAELVDETLSAMARDLAKDGIRLIRRIPPRLAIHTRPAVLKQVLLNLILNARAAVLKKSRRQTVCISVLRQDNRVLIRVADTGVGIAAQDLPRIFEPFYSTGSGGTGLGLTVCRHIVSTLDGRLSVRSQLGKGTCFTMSLPTHERRHRTQPGRRLHSPAAG